MNPLQVEHERASAVFLAARQLPHQEREAFLRRECGENPQLLAGVQLMLEHDARSATPLDQPVVGEGTRDGAMNMLEHDAPLLRRVGKYEIVRLIAGGGMGSVYEARQEQPNRLVALKMIRRGIASRAVLRRFEHESQILARLRHPNIAQVYEAGVHDDGEGGAPYFAMEYIAEAQPITEYAQGRGLSTRLRLDLFRQVCDAVSHGHQRGVIHRDLKPGNILVDSACHVKVIDFGVARAIDSDIAVTTMQTDVGQLLGTLQYMSPEQAEADPHDLDVRSDVYSLGVVLYELLTDELPYDVSHARVYEAARIIREQAPARPSSVNRALRGDLETIVLKALEKDRSRRYQSVAELSADLDRFINNQPITARPPSVLYQLRTFARRNRAVVVGVAATFMALLIGLVATTAALIEAGRETTRAEAETIKAQQAEAAAERRAADLERVSAFQTNLFHNIDTDAMGDQLRAEQRRQIEAGLRKRHVAHEDGTRPLTDDEIERLIVQFDDLAMLTNPIDLARHVIREAMFKPALVAIERDFTDDPALEARLRWTIAWAGSQVGTLDISAAQLPIILELHKRAYDGDHPEVATVLERVGINLQVEGDYAGSQNVLRDVLAMRRRLFGDEHKAVAETMTSLARVLRGAGKYEDAEQFDHKGLAIARAINDPQLIVECMIGQGATLYWGGNRPAAEKVYLEALSFARAELRQNDTMTHNALMELAHFYADAGDWQRAEPYALELVASARKTRGSGHSGLGQALFAIGKVLRHKRDHEEAEANLHEALEIFRRDEGERAPRVGWILDQIASSQMERGAYAESIATFRDAVAIRREAEGEEHKWFAAITNKFALALRYFGEYDEAEEAFRLAVRVRRVHPNRATVAYSLHGLALTLMAKGEYAEAQSHLKEAIEIWQSIGRADRSAHAFAVANLGSAIAKQGNLVEGEELIRRALVIDEAAPDRNAADTAVGLSLLAEVLSLKGDLEAATELHREALALRRRHLFEHHPRTLESLCALAEILMSRGAFTEAEQYALECADGRVLRFGDDHRFTVAAKQLLVEIHAAMSGALSEPVSFESRR